MESICLNIPYMPLSTKVNGLRETEKRFVTPFGTIDIIFRAALDLERQEQRLEIEVGGDAEYWVSCDTEIKQFRATLLYFAWGIAKDYLGKKGHLGPKEVSLYLKGSEIDLMGLRGNIFSGE